MRHARRVGQMDGLWTSQQLLSAARPCSGSCSSRRPTRSFPLGLTDLFHLPPLFLSLSLSSSSFWRPFLSPCCSPPPTFHPPSPPPRRAPPHVVSQESKEGDLLGDATVRFAERRTTIGTPVRPPRRLSRATSGVEYDMEGYARVPSLLFLSVCLSVCVSLLVFLSLCCLEAARERG